jgi:DNA-binding NtrC family response regulator
VRKAKSKTPKKLSEGALRVLLAYDWPGNVRELEHILEGAVLLSSGDTISEADLSHHLIRGERTSMTAVSTDPGSPAGEGGSPLSLDELERQHIERVLKQYQFSRTRTADALGISKKTLYLKIKRYGMKVAD